MAKIKIHAFYCFNNWIRVIHCAREFSCSSVIADCFEAKKHALYNVFDVSIDVWCVHRRMFNPHGKVNLEL